MPTQNKKANTYQAIANTLALSGVIADNATPDEVLAGVLRLTAAKRQLGKAQRGLRRHRAQHFKSLNIIGADAYNGFETVLEFLRTHSVTHTDNRDRQHTNEVISGVLRRLINAGLTRGTATAAEHISEAVDRLLAENKQQKDVVHMLVNELLKVNVVGQPTNTNLEALTVGIGNLLDLLSEMRTSRAAVRQYVKARAFLVEAGYLTPDESLTEGTVKIIRAVEDKDKQIGEQRVFCENYQQVRQALGSAHMLAEGCMSIVEPVKAALAIAADNQEALATLAKLGAVQGPDETLAEAVSRALAGNGLNTEAAEALAHFKKMRAAFERIGVIEPGKPFETTFGAMAQGLALLDDTQAARNYLKAHGRKGKLLDEVTSLVRIAEAANGGERMLAPDTAMLVRQRLLNASLVEFDAGTDETLLAIDRLIKQSRKNARKVGNSFMHAVIEKLEAAKIQPQGGLFTIEALLELIDKLIAAKGTADPLRAALHEAASAVGIGNELLSVNTLLERLHYLQEYEQASEPHDEVMRAIIDLIAETCGEEYNGEPLNGLRMIVSLLEQKKASTIALFHSSQGEANELGKLREQHDELIKKHTYCVESNHLMCEALGLSKTANYTREVILRHIKNVAEASNKALAENDRLKHLNRHAELFAQSLGKTTADFYEAIYGASQGDWQRLKEFGINSAAPQDGLTEYAKRVETDLIRAEKDVARFKSHIVNIGNVLQPAFGWSSNFDNQIERIKRSVEIAEQAKVNTANLRELFSKHGLDNVGNDADILRVITNAFEFRTETGNVLADLGFPRSVNSVQIVADSWRKQSGALDFLLAVMPALFGEGVDPYRDGGLKWALAEIENLKQRAAVPVYADVDRLLESYGLTPANELGRLGLIERALVFRKQVGEALGTVNPNGLFSEKRALERIKVLDSALAAADELMLKVDELEKRHQHRDEISQVTFDALCAALGENYTGERHWRQSWLIGRIKALVKHMTRLQAELEMTLGLHDAAGVPDRDTPFSKFMHKAGEAGGFGKAGRFLHERGETMLRQGNEHVANMLFDIAKALEANSKTANEDAEHILATEVRPAQLNKQNFTDSIKDENKAFEKFSAVVGKSPHADVFSMPPIVNRQVSHKAQRKALKKSIKKMHRKVDRLLNQLDKHIEEYEKLKKD